MYYNVWKFVFNIMAQSRIFRAFVMTSDFTIIDSQISTHYNTY